METITLPRERSFTANGYRKLTHAGILRADARVELLDGRIYVMAPMGSRHAECVRRPTEKLALEGGLVLEVASRARVSVQNPVRLDNHSEPEPDLALLDPKEVYIGRHPAVYAAELLPGIRTVT